MLGKFSIPVPAVSSPTQTPWQKERWKRKKKEREKERGGGKERISVLQNLWFLRDCHIIIRLWEKACFELILHFLRKQEYGSWCPNISAVISGWFVVGWLVFFPFEWTRYFFFLLNRIRTFWSSRFEVCLHGTAAIRSSLLSRTLSSGAPVPTCTHILPPKKHMHTRAYMNTHAHTTPHHL